jgi:excisionase family DNA binding protein
MAGRWSDEHIAATLNRMGLTTGQDKTWTAERVYTARRLHGIRSYRSAQKDNGWLTLREAAKALGVSSHLIRQLIAANVLPAVQVVRGAPYQIRTDDLASPTVKAAIARNAHPCCVTEQRTLPIFPNT